MAKTVGTLKATIAAYIIRDLTSFIRGGQDIVLVAINNAKDFCQRAIDFEFANVFAQLDNVSLINGGDLANAKLFGTATAVTLKSIKQVWVRSSSGYDVPIDLLSRHTWANRVKRRFANSGYDLTAIGTWTATDFVCAVQYGTTIYVQPASSVYWGAGTVTLCFDAFKWLPDFTADADTNFLLDYCFDYLLLRSLSELNYYLKDDERVRISTELLAVEWDNVVHWNANIVKSSVADVNLD